MLKIEYDRLTPLDHLPLAPPFLKLMSSFLKKRKNLVDFAILPPTPLKLVKWA